VPVIPIDTCTTHSNGYVPATVNCKHAVCPPGAPDTNVAVAAAPGWLWKLWSPVVVNFTYWPAVIVAVAGVNVSLVVLVEIVVPMSPSATPVQLGTTITVDIAADPDPDPDPEPEPEPEPEPDPDPDPAASAVRLSMAREASVVWLLSLLHAASAATIKMKRVMRDRGAIAVRVAHETSLSVNVCCMRKLWSAVVAVIVIGAAWLCVDNVFSDNAPVRELAERAACAAKPCAEHHGLTRELRRPWAQQFDYAWRDATVHVICRREYYVVGERRCTVGE
jgi:hypothetical protein